MARDICLDGKTLFDVIKFYIDKAVSEGMSQEQREALIELLSKLSAGNSQRPPGRFSF